MNRVLFDLSVCQPNAESKFHGGGVYGYIVFKRLTELTSENIKVYYYKSRFLEPSTIKIIEEKGIEVYDGDSFTFEESFNRANADIVYSPLYSTHHDPIIKKGIKFVVTIHGLRSLEMLTDSMEADYSTSFAMWIKAIMKSSLLKHKVYRRNYQRYGQLLMASNVQVITVSNHSKYSIKCYYPDVNVDKISVFYSPSTTTSNYSEFERKGQGKYYLIISANRWLKNAGRAIAALDLLLEKTPNLCNEVKVLGLKKETNIYKRIKCKEKFTLLGYQTQEDLEQLYSGAYAFIYPSLNEGFGYPPLEAMKYGTPVISSPLSSIPEVCGDAVIYANPYSIEEIANRILQLEDANTHKIYEKKGVERYQLISERQERDLNELCQLLLSCQL